MLEEIRLAAGYLSILVLPVMLVTGVLLHHAYLAFDAVVLIFPLVRSVVGAYRLQSPIVWHEATATFLDRLPVLYAVCLVMATVVVIGQTNQGAAGTPSAAIGVALSLWMVMLFATCPAHELIHRRDAADVRWGWFVAGLSGYPLLVFEHAIHHGRSGDTVRAEWPRLDESVWQFSGRRIRRILHTAALHGIGHWRSGCSQALKAAAVTGLTLLAFTLAGGWSGFLIYTSVIIGVTFGVQLITYLQHWGLGDDSLVDANVRQYAWEDDCLFQAWVTLNISFHQYHHGAPRLPYYRVGLMPDSPRLPAGYLVLMVVCLFPPLWRRLMLPALDHWKVHPTQPRSPGRRITCFYLYDGESAKDDTS